MISFKEFCKLNEVTEPSVSYNDYGAAFANASDKRKNKVIDIVKFTKTKYTPENFKIQGTVSTYCSNILFVSKNNTYFITYKTEDDSGRHNSTLKLSYGSSYKEFKLPPYAKVTKDDIIKGLKQINEIINDGSLSKYIDKLGPIEFNSTFNKLVSE